MGICQVGSQHIHSPCGTVVIEVVVSIHAVLGHIVDIDSLDDVPFLLVRQVQHLLCHTASVVAVLSAESFKRFNAHLIVGQPKEEAQNEMGFLEREQPVVHCQVLTVSLVVDANGGMTVQTVNRFVRGTSEQTDFH